MKAGIVPRFFFTKSKYIVYKVKMAFYKAKPRFGKKAPMKILLYA